MVLKAAVNIHGPDGELVKEGEEIPEDWPEDLKKALKESGGAVVGRKEKK
jgi:hypothetical protein